MDFKCEIMNWHYKHRFFSLKKFLTLNRKSFNFMGYREIKLVNINDFLVTPSMISIAVIFFGLIK